MYFGIPRAFTDSRFTWERQLFVPLQATAGLKILRVAEKLEDGSLSVRLSSEEIEVVWDGRTMQTRTYIGTRPTPSDSESGNNLPLQTLDGQFVDPEDGTVLFGELSQTTRRVFRPEAVRISNEICHTRGHGTFVWPNLESVLLKR